MRTHYPRTRHLPWSPGATADDLRVTDLSGLRGREVVVTEKLDGENTTLYADGLHARSLDSAHHPSRARVKALQGRIGHAIPEGWRVCGENMYARHSIAYKDLESWFYGFSVWDADGHCLDWERTVTYLRGFGIPVPRVLWRGLFDERALRALRLDPVWQEGYVVRSTAWTPPWLPEGPWCGTPRPSTSSSARSSTRSPTAATPCSPTPWSWSTRTS